MCGKVVWQGTDRRLAMVEVGRVVAGESGTECSSSSSSSSGKYSSAATVKAVVPISCAPKAGAKQRLHSPKPRGAGHLLTADHIKQTKESRVGFELPAVICGWQQTPDPQQCAQNSSTALLGTHKATNSAIDAHVAIVISSVVPCISGVR